MEDPVILSDGNSYERDAIRRWLETSNRSPKTNQPLEAGKTLYPNHALKVLIDVFVQNNEIKQAVCA